MTQPSDELTKAVYRLCDFFLLEFSEWFSIVTERKTDSFNALQEWNEQSIKESRFSETFGGFIEDRYSNFMFKSEEEGEDNLDFGIDVTLAWIYARLDGQQFSSIGFGTFHFDGHSKLVNSRVRTLEEIRKEAKEFLNAKKEWDALGKGRSRPLPYHQLLHFWVQLWKYLVKQGHDLALSIGHRGFASELRKRTGLMDALRKDFDRFSKLENPNRYSNYRTVGFSFSIDLFWHAFLLKKQDSIDHNHFLSGHSSAEISRATKDSIQRRVVRPNVSLRSPSQDLDLQRESFAEHWIDQYKVSVHQSSTVDAEREGKDFVGELVNDLCIEIFKLLDFRSVVRSSLVCKSWNAVTNDENLWTYLTKRFIGDCRTSDKAVEEYSKKQFQALVKEEREERMRKIKEEEEEDAEMNMCFSLYD